MFCFHRKKYRKVVQEDTCKSTQFVCGYPERVDSVWTIEACEKCGKEFAWLSNGRTREKYDPQYIRVKMALGK